MHGATIKIRVKQLISKKIQIKNSLPNFEKADELDYTDKSVYFIFDLIHVFLKTHTHIYVYVCERHSYIYIYIYIYIYTWCSQ